MSSIASPDQIDVWVREARRRTLALVQDLTDEQLRVPLLPIVNPFLWEIGHVAWFQELYALRRAAGESPQLPHGDELYDSSAVGHDTRWELALPSREETVRYLQSVVDRVSRRLQRGDLGQEDTALTLLALFHEDMHAEAFLYMRQTLGYAPPELDVSNAAAIPSATADESGGDVSVPGGVFPLGAPRGGGFVFDNEQWEHPVELAPFRIARTCVSQGEFVRFIEDGGYARRSLWSDDGWASREAERAEHPTYLRRQADGSWLERCFDRWIPLRPRHPVIHVSWHEANSFCAWAGRRLPTEAEWEAAAAGEPAPDGSLGRHRRRFPWGDTFPDDSRANLDALRMGTVDVSALPRGDSAFGCRQMIGNVWEWTSSTFEPYPGFERGAYEDYSEPWFGTRKVLRGGAWATRGRMLRNTWRNYFTPDRRDVFAGFRTCAVDGCES